LRAKITKNNWYACIAVNYFLSPAKRTNFSILSEMHVNAKILILSLCMPLLSWAQHDAPAFGVTDKIAGLNLVAQNQLMDSTQIEPIYAMHANWTAVIPYAFVRDLHKPEVLFNTQFQWVGERVEGVTESVRLLHQRGIQVMLKPQIWVGHGDFTGHIEMYSNEDWLLFEEGYRSYVLCYAKLAEEEGVEMLCLGTELGIFVSQRPAFWRRLIEEVRSVYSGKLTYAENWDSYAKVPFWDLLDYIGVDAYFPLAKGKNPKLKVLKQGWEPIRDALTELAEHAGRPILFTEYGYRSTARCAEEPWNYRENDELSEKAQCHALQSLYESLWHDPHFAGGFLWKWYPNAPTHDHRDHYAIQGKLAEALVREFYARDQKQASEK
jgi:hypothetical protein